VIESFHKKYEWKGVLSIFELDPKGLVDPFSWRKIIWVMDNKIINNGNKKWNEKNRVKVALSIEKPPHNHCVKILPKYGMADKRLVITVAPQKDICPHGST